MLADNIKIYIKYFVKILKMKKLIFLLILPSLLFTQEKSTSKDITKREIKKK